MNINSHSFIPESPNRCILCTSKNTVSTQGLRYTHITPQQSAPRAIFTPVRRLSILDGNGLSADLALRFLSEKKRLEVAPVCRAFNTFASSHNVYRQQKALMNEALSLLISYNTITRGNLFHLSDADCTIYKRNVTAASASIATVLTEMGEIDIALNLTKLMPDNDLIASVNCSILESLEAQNKTDEAKVFIANCLPFAEQAAIYSQAIGRLKRFDYVGVVELLKKLTDAKNTSKIFFALVETQAIKEEEGVVEATLDLFRIPPEVKFTALCVIDVARGNLTAANEKLRNHPHSHKNRQLTAYAMCKALVKMGRLYEAAEITLIVPEIINGVGVLLLEKRFDQLDTKSAYLYANQKSDLIKKIHLLSCIVSNQLSTKGKVNF